VIDRREVTRSFFLLRRCRCASRATGDARGRWRGDIASDGHSSLPDVRSRAVEWIRRSQSKRTTADPHDESRPIAPTHGADAPMHSHSHARIHRPSCSCLCQFTLIIHCQTRSFAPTAISTASTTPTMSAPPTNHAMTDASMPVEEEVYDEDDLGGTGGEDEETFAEDHQE
jgi:hypothetical protein